MNCAEHSDIDCLSKFQFPQEVGAGWTKENVDYVYKNIIGPFWDKQRKVGPVSTQELSSQGLAGQSYQLVGGEVFPRTMDAVASDGNVPRTLLSEDLQETFTAMYAAGHPNDGKGMRMLKGILAGIEKYGPDLEARGVRGIVTKEDVQGNVTLVPFSKCKINLQRQIQQLESGAIHSYEPATSQAP